MCGTRTQLSKCGRRRGGGDVWYKNPALKAWEKEGRGAMCGTRTQLSKRGRRRGGGVCVVQEPSSQSVGEGGGNVWYMNPASKEWGRRKGGCEVQGPSSQSVGKEGVS